MQKMQRLQRLKLKNLTFDKWGFAVVFTIALFILSWRSAQAEFGSIVDIGLAGDIYFTNESANNGQGFVNLLIQNTWSESQLWVDLGAGGLVGDTASSYVKVPQLYYRWGAEDRVHWIVGRYRQEWSHGDQVWDLGLTQPIFRWNEAMPEQQGVTGLFLKIPMLNKDFQVTLFASGLFLPTQGPSYELINGRLTSSNPWFAAPVEAISLAGQKAELNFNINIPKTQDIVFNKSFGVQFASQPNKKDLLFNAFYLDKPKNDFMLPFEGVLNLSTFNGDITVLPQLARHRVGGVDVGWNFVNAKTVLSWIHESSVDYTPLANTTYAVIPQQDIFSFNQLFRLSPSQRLWISYIQVERDNTRLGGVYSNAAVDAYSYRNRYENTLRLKWEALLYRSLNQYKVQSTFAYNQSMLRDTMWLSARLDWSVYKGLQVFNQCDFFGGSAKTIVSQDLMSAYQNNDRCLVGGHYAF